MVSHGAEPEPLLAEQPRAAASSEALSLSAHRDGYDPLPSHTLRMYGAWDHIVEPESLTHFRVTNAIEGCAYSWNITRRDGDGRSVFVGDGSSIQARFSGVNGHYRVTVAERAASGSGFSTCARSYLSDTVVTKYVRREIRTLSDADREAYFSALEAVFTLSLEEGQAKHGDKFISHSHLVALHNSLMYVYHDNLDFLTSHPAFQMKVDGALRAVDPGVQTPYWDFLQDHDLGTEWTTSPIYNKDWFGTVDNSAADNYRIRGRFRNVSLIWDPNVTEAHTGKMQFPRSEHNPYGYLTSRLNANEVPYLQRSNHACNFPATQTFSSCDNLMHCFTNYTTLYEWDMCLERKVHANIHTMHSGLYECSVSWKEAADEYDWLDEHLLSFVGNQLAAMIRGSSFSDYITCPTACHVHTESFDDGCHCGPSTEANFTRPEDVDAITDLKAYTFMEDTLKGLYKSAYDGKRFIKYYAPGENNGFSYVFRNLTSDQTATLNKLIIKTVIWPGTWGVMGGGAAPNDPLFWVIHQILDKAFHALRLSPVYNRYNVSWDNHAASDDRTEYGTGWNALTPFKADLFGLGHRTHASREENAHTAEATDDERGPLVGKDYLTNKQLWALLKPDGGAIPYVYDNMKTWGTCDFDPLEQMA